MGAVARLAEAVVGIKMLVGAKEPRVLDCGGEIGLGRLDAPGVHRLDPGRGQGGRLVLPVDFAGRGVAVEGGGVDGVRVLLVQVDERTGVEKFQAKNLATD